jgi:acyl carrier protein
MFIVKTLCGRAKVVECGYIPFGTDKSTTLLTQGKSISGKALSNEEIKELEKILAEEAKTNIEEKVVLILAEESGTAPDEITLTTNLKSDLLLEDFDIEGIVPALEDEFDCLISDEAFQEWQTVGDIVSFIKNTSGQ